MTRDDFITIRNKELSNTLTGEDIATVLHEYCNSKGATSSHAELIKMCIVQLLQSGRWGNYWKIAKSYFNCKFTVYECWSKEYQTPFGPQRDLLMIY